MSDGTYPQWSTIQPLLDDPGVSGADKTRLLTDYAQQAAYDNPISGTVNQDYVDHMADIARYAQQYHATDAFRDVTALHGPFGDGSAPAPDRQVFADQLARARDSQQVGRAKTQLADEAKRTVANGGAGVRTSDEILEPGSRGMYFFQYFGPPYRDWTGDALDPQKDVRDVYDSLRGIQFAKFRADAAQLSTSHGKLSDRALNLATATGSLGGFWQGRAAEAAQRYRDSFVRQARTATDGLTAASQVITTSMQAIETAVLQRAQGVLPLYATDIGGVTPDGVRQLIDIAKHRADDDALRSVTTWPVFHNVDWGDTDCHGKLSQNVRNLAAKDATRWLNDTFVPAFDQKKRSFDSITRSTHDTVRQSFDAMNQGLAEIDANPFGDQDPGVEVSGAPAIGGLSGGGSARGGSAAGGTAASGGGAVAPPLTVDPTLADTEPVGFTDPASQATTLSSVTTDDDLGGGVATGGALDPNGGDVSGAVVDGGQAAASHMPAAHHLLGGPVTPPGHAGVAGTDVTPVGQPGGAGLASAPDGALDQGGAAGLPMMPMGGMGATGQGGDQQRAGQQQWRTFGHLFDDATGDDTIGRFSGTLDDGR